ncbi:MAG: hypothetical protein AAF702_08960 [Chloroflexota bacterium]
MKANFSGRLYRLITFTIKIILGTLYFTPTGAAQSSQHQSSTSRISPRITLHELLRFFYALP